MEPWTLCGGFHCSGSVYWDIRTVDVEIILMTAFDDA